MAVRDSVVNLLLKATNAISGPTDEAAQSLYAAQLAVDDLNRELKSLDKQAQLIEDFKALSSETDAIAQRFGDAQKNLADLQTQFKATKTPSADLREELARAKVEAQQATSAYKSHEKQLESTGTQLKRAGIDTQELGKEEQSLKNRVNETREKVKESAVTLKEHADKLRENEKGAGSLGGALNKLKGLLIAYGANRALKSLMSLSDEYQTLRGQIQMVIGDHEKLDDVWADVVKTANDISMPVETVTDLYVQLRRSTKDLNIKQEDTIKLSKTLVQAFGASGESIDSATSQVRNLARGLAEGNLSANDLNRLFRRTPELANAMADSFGISREALAALVKEGKIDSNLFLKGALEASDALLEKAKQMPDTIGQAMQRLKNDLLDAFGSADLTGFNQAIDDFRQTVTDPGFVAATVSLGEAVSTFAKVTASAVKEGVEFTKWLGEEFAATIHGVADDDMVRLQQQAERLKAAMEGPWMSRDIRDALKSQKELSIEYSETMIKIYALQQAQEDAAKATAQAQKKNQDAIKETGAATDETKEKTTSLKEEIEALGETKNTIDPVRKALKDLGFDATYALEGISTAADEAINSFSRTGEKIKDLGLTAEQQSRVMSQAFDRAFSSAKSIKELERLKSALDNAYKSGQIGVQEYATRVNELNQEMDKLKDKEVTIEINIEADELAAANEQTENLGKNIEQVGEKAKSGKGGFVVLINFFNDLAAAGFTAAEQMEALARSHAVALTQFGDTYTSWANALHVIKTQMIEANELAGELTEQIRKASTSGTDDLQGLVAEASRLVTAAEKGRDTFRHLANERLDPLRDAIADAERRMQSLTDSASSTLQNVRKDLANIEGDRVLVQQIEQAQKLQRLEEQLVIARNAGNREAIKDLQEAINLQIEIGNIKAQQLKDEGLAADKLKKNKITEADTQLSKKQVYEVRLQGIKGGKDAILTAQTQAEADRFLQILEQAGLTTT